jgi:hypothetical protein
VRTISLLSAIDVEEEPKSFTESELQKEHQKHLEETVTIAAAKSVPFNRLFQASTIVTI